DIEMRIYNDKGVSQKKYHKGDMYDGAANGGNLVTDERFLGVRHTIASYPTTIETEYEEDISSLVDLSGWEIQDNEQSVQNAFVHLQIANDAGFRYLEKNIKIKPEKKAVENLDDYTWKVSNLKAFKIEEGAVSWRVLPRIYFADNNFEFYGVKGNFSTWTEFGKFIKGLNADVCTLSPQREEEIRKMTDTIKTDIAKAEFLYNYMQKSMRYVSVQLGIGGLKPFPATFVDQQKYGDCKALSNYMYALLKAVHIPSNYAVINAEANKEPADFSFPYNGFNHVILCIPFKGDTSWVECTSSITKFGKLGPFTENRTALLISDEGGKLVNTPRSKMEDNQFNSEALIVLDAEGGAKTQIKLLGTGEYRDDYINIASIKMDDQKEAYQRMLNIKQPSTFNITSGSDISGVKEVDLDLEYDKFCDVMAGNKQFYKPRAFDLCAFSVPIEEKRKSDFYFEHPMQKSCVTTIELPAGFDVETLPVNQSLKFTYGSYDITYVYNAAKNQVVSTAKFNITNHVIPAAKYTELQQYIDAVARAQNKKLVIKRKA
ncbi:MAG: transglutaminase family protein, partial [Mucilaginibacter sp.]